MALCCVLYTGAFVLCTATVCGLIRVTTLVKLVFGLPFIYHIFVEDLPVLIKSNPPRTAVEWLPEISVLLIILSLLITVCSFEREKSAIMLDSYSLHIISICNYKNTAESLIWQSYFSQYSVCLYLFPYKKHIM